MEYFGKPQIDTRKIESSITNYAQSDEASNERFQAETFHILNEKYEHHSKIYTDGSRKDEKVRYAVVLSESTIKRKQFPQNSIFSAEQSAIINAIYSTYNQKRVIITDSLSTIIAVSNRKDPRT
jgi:hypothetical protein